jgi:hypothetical protein
MDSWDDIVNLPFGPYDLENLPAGMILSEVFLNTFAKAIDERFNVLYPANSYTDRFQKGEIMETVFYNKVRNLVGAFRNLFTGYDWCDPVLLNDPVEDPRTPAGDYLNIKTSDIQNLLDYGTNPIVFNTIWNIGGARNDWNNLKRADVWSGCYKIYKFLTCYYEPYIGFNGIIERRPILQSSSSPNQTGKTSDDPAKDGFTVNTANAFRGVYVGTWAGWPAEVDFNATQQRQQDSQDVYLLENNMSLIYNGINGFYDCWHFDQKGWDGFVNNQLNLHRGEVGYSYGHPNDLEIQCKRKRDGFVLTMNMSVLINLSINCIKEEYINNQGGSVTQPNVVFDPAYPFKDLATGIDLITLDNRVVSQETKPYGEVTVFSYSQDPPAVYPELRPVVNDLQDPPPVPTGFTDNVSKFHQFVYGYKDICFIEVNNPDLDYYIAP